jgi:hypothetical protein
VADHGEAVEPERIGHRRGVGGHGADRSTGLRGRAAVPGPVVAHPAQVQPLGELEERVRRRSHVRCPVVPEHREPAVRGGVVDVQGPPVAQVHVALPHDPILTRR